MKNSNSPMNNDDKTLHIELFIASLLRWGVILSFVIIAVWIGATLLTGQTGYHQVRLDDFNSITQYRMPPDFPNSLEAVWTGVIELKPYAVIVLGLLVLISIPVVRVAVSVIAFAFERDWLYAAITAFVLIVLILSFIIGWVEG